MTQNARAFNWDSIPFVTTISADPAIEVVPDGNTYITIAAGKRFKPEIAYISLVASADAANRTLALRIDDGTTVLYQSPWGITITAGQTRTQSWCKSSLVVTVGTQYGMHIPDIEMQAGWRLSVVSASFDAVAPGDNASALTVYGKEAPA